MTKQASVSPAFDQLAQFANWFVRDQGFRIPPCIFDGVTKAGKNTGLVLYRDPPYQVQLWICDPNSEIPEHTHPNMDTIIIYLSGEFYVKVNGEPVLTKESLYAMPDGMPSVPGAWLRVGPNDKHSAMIGPKGCAFLNFGRFLDGKPRSADLDWEGPSLV